jgi:UDP-N-acetylmuramate--alanine ligase
MAKIFFSGIGGSGLSAIAVFMADRGHSIVGSDRSFDRSPDNPICNILKSKGITIVPQDGSGINTSIDLAVFSTAVEDNQPEFIKARQLDIPMKTRPQYLCEIVSEFRTIAVAGTSGKSTIAGLLAFLLNKLGLEPNFIGGGRVKQFKSESNLGNSLSGSSDLLVIEACESDGSIVHYHPLHSIIANLSLDHNSIEKTGEMFETWKEHKQMLNIGGDENLRRCRFDNPVRFSIDTDSEYKAEAVEYLPMNANLPYTESHLTSLPFKYNLYNALSSIALFSKLASNCSISRRSS